LAALIAAPIAGSFVPNLAPEKHDGDKNSENKRADLTPKETTDERLADYTLWLVIVTGGLVVIAAIQTRLLFNSDKTAKELVSITGSQMAIAARQTDIIEKQHAIGRLQFIATHRPRVVVRFIQGSTQDDPPSVFVTVVNIGVGEATIVQFGGDIGWKRELASTVFTGSIFAGPKPISPIILQSGERHTFEITGRATTTLGRHMAVLGAIRYADAAGVERETGFCRYYDNVRSRFDPSDRSEEEYCD